MGGDKGVGDDVDHPYPKHDVRYEIIVGRMAACAVSACREARVSAKPWTREQRPVMGPHGKGVAEAGTEAAQGQRCAA
jgi:hypothetical protein